MGNDQNSPGIRVLRDADFKTVTPDGFRVGVVNSDPDRRVVVVTLNEDTLPDRLDGAGEVVFFETSRLMLRPDRAMELARLLIKSLDVVLQFSPEQAARYGVTRDHLAEIGGAQFDAVKKL